MQPCIPTREEALRRLAEFLPHAGRAYAKLRNYDLGAGNHRHVSTLSPWIRHRLILEEEVVSATLAKHSFSAAEKFIQEVFWRTYWKGWLERRPAIWHDYRAALDRRMDDLDRESDLRDQWRAATAGQTGIDCFDAWAGELVETGYLHNHARMWFASIWIFTLKLPWELGADFFLRHLLDGDPASNTLSWRWVAGLQTRGKTYLARPDNIARYTEGRFKPHDIAPAAPPLDGPVAPAPIPVPESGHWDRGLPSGLLVTEEDLCPDFLVDPQAGFKGAAAMTATNDRSPLGASPLVGDFVDGAVDDTIERLAGRLGVPSIRCPDVDAIVDWATREVLRQVVTAYVPVGPTATAVQNLSRVLAGHDIRLVQVVRKWDAAAWPHATRGFFPFREKIPAILRQVSTPTQTAA